MLRVERLWETAALERLRPEWERLWAADPQAGPFQSPGWLIPWWRQIGRGELSVLAFRCSGELVGLVPLSIYSRDGSRILFPVGVATTDYLDVIAAPAFRRPVIGSFWEILGELRGEWDECELPQLHPGALLLEGGPDGELCEQRSQCEPSPVVKLPLELPSSLEQNLRYYRRRAKRSGAVVVEEGEHLFEEVIRLHTLRWSAREKRGVLADEAVQRWHREALPQLAALEVLRLLGLRIGGRMAAVLYGLVDRKGVPERRFYYYLGGFDPELSPMSPGTLLIAAAADRAAADRAAAEGCGVFDFLRGREPYKYLWGAVDQPAWRRSFRASRRPAEKEALCERC